MSFIKLFYTTPDGITGRDTYSSLYIALIHDYYCDGVYTEIKIYDKTEMIENVYMIKGNSVFNKIRDLIKPLLKLRFDPNNNVYGKPELIVKVTFNESKYEWWNLSNRFKTKPLFIPTIYEMQQYAKIINTLKDIGQNIYYKGDDFKINSAIRKKLPFE